jgi:hypothetical protein
MDRRYTIYIFVWDDEVFERISKTKTDDLRVLYEIVFDAKEVSSWWRTRILRFDGFDFAKGSSDYNSLEESDSRNLRFGSWLLNVQTNGREEVLCQEICSSLCRRSAVGGKTSNGAETYRTVSVYRSVECCNERSMESQAAKLNVGEWRCYRRKKLKTGRRSLHWSML